MPALLGDKCGFDQVLALAKQLPDTNLLEALDIQRAAAFTFSIVAT